MADLIISKSDLPTETGEEVMASRLIRISGFFGCQGDLHPSSSNDRVAACGINSSLKKYGSETTGGVVEC